MKNKLQAAFALSSAITVTCLFGVSVGTPAEETAHHADIAKLRSNLRAESWRTRRAAAYELGEARAQDAMPDLAFALGDREFRVSLAAQQALDKYGIAPADLVPTLLNFFGDSDRAVVQQAARALGTLGPEARTAVPALTRALDDESTHAEVMQTAIVTLGKMGPSASEASAAIARHLTNKALRPSAIQAISSVGITASALEVLEKGLHSQDLPVWIVHARTLGFITPEARDAVTVELLEQLAKPLDGIEATYALRFHHHVALWAMERIGFEHLERLCGHDAAERFRRLHEKMEFDAQTRENLLAVADRFAMTKLGENDIMETYILPVPKDAAARQRSFSERNAPASLRQLCIRLHGKLLRNSPGLEHFDRLVGEERYDDALKAYRAFFFDKLSNLEQYGLREELFFNSYITPVKGRASYYIPEPYESSVKANMAGVALHYHAQTMRQVDAVGFVGEPGTVAWGPEVADATEDSVRAERLAHFHRALNAIPPSPVWGLGLPYNEGLFKNLLFAYAQSGNRDYLNRWMAYADDWLLHSKDAIYNSPVNIRNARELEGQDVRFVLAMLYVLNRRQPAVSNDFCPATLARLLLRLNDEYLPYTIRAKRAEQANWGMIGSAYMMHAATIIPEFKAMRDATREGWRLWMSNHIQHRTLDGGNIEAWDWGHGPMDIENAKDFLLHGARLPDEADEMERRVFWDHINTHQRNILVHMTPWGSFWPSFTDAGSNRIVDGRGSGHADSIHHLVDIENEAEVQRRLNAVLNLDIERGATKELFGYEARPYSFTYRATDEPPRTRSDIAPYAAMYYLRDGWHPDAEYFMMDNFLVRSQTSMLWNHRGHIMGSSRTMYALSKNQRQILNATPIAVDRKPDNRYLAMGTPRTGGKTKRCAQAGRHVVDTRFHTSARFDLAEAKQDAPYARPGAIHGAYDHWYGLYDVAPRFDNTPITDITAYRQVFSVVGEGLYFIANRIENPSSTQREFCQMLTVGADAGHCNRVDSAGRAVHTGNPDRANLSLHFALDAAVTFAGRLVQRNGDYEFEPDLTSRHFGWYGDRDKQVISARWEARESHVMVNTLYTRPPLADTEAKGAYLEHYQELTGEGGAKGAHVVMPTGAQAWFLSTIDRQTPLHAGPVQAEAETVLAVLRDGEVSGMALSCRSLRINGVEFRVDVEDFEYVLSPGGQFATRPIYRPIDTVQVQPEANRFTETVEISFDIPTQDTRDIEYRYTLDGTDPTIESNLYTGPFKLDDTAHVKVRPFRKGLQETPWNIPGVEGGKTISALYRKEKLRPAIALASVVPGLEYQYLEGYHWPQLVTYAGWFELLQPSSAGHAKGLLRPAEVAAIRKTDMAYAIRYRGLIRVPESGVYSFYAPEHLYTSTMDAGYDLRVWIAGEEWWPAPMVHSENVWHIPLEAGLHEIKVSFADYRYKTFRSEYWMTWQEEQMWQGVPVLEMSGPNLTRQPVPEYWLFRQKPFRRRAP